MTVAITGAGGFLGWHTRVRAHAERRVNGAADVRPIGMDPSVSTDLLAAAVSGAEHIVHLAGVNRGSEGEVRDGNILLAARLAAGIRYAARPPQRIVFANSVQAATGGTYGDAKRRAADLLAECADQVGAEFVDVPLPNLFGEHGRPFYNSVTATFCHQLANGETPQIHRDQELSMLHVQDAAAILLGNVKPGDAEARLTRIRVSALRDKLQYFAAVYATGAIPALESAFDIALFNTYRSYTFPALARRELATHGDARGEFSEVIRCHGGTGQTSFSTTVPGVTRGDHFHLAKVERFAVLSGTARISLRRVLTDDVVHVDVDGERPAYVDMPTMWAHNITNVGSAVLCTLFWTNDLFDPAAPDTYREVV